MRLSDDLEAKGLRHTITEVLNPVISYDIYIWLGYTAADFLRFFYASFYSLDQNLHATSVLILQVSLMQK
jgi:hypothetical protein